MGSILFGLYDNFNGKPWSRVSNLLYQSFSRLLWAIGLSYIIFSCLNFKDSKKNSFYFISLQKYLFILTWIQLKKVSLISFWACQFGFLWAVLHTVLIWFICTFCYSKNNLSLKYLRNYIEYLFYSFLKLHNNFGTYISLPRFQHSKLNEKKIKKF